MKNSDMQKIFVDKTRSHLKSTELLGELVARTSKRRNLTSARPYVQIKNIGVYRKRIFIY